MTEYKVFAPNVTVDSARIVGFVSSFPPGMKETGIHILEKHGIIDVRPGGWQPVQPWLDAMKEISERFDAKTLYQIGERIALHADIPNDLKSLHACLSNLNKLYRNDHHGKKIGGWEYEHEENGRWKQITLTSTSHYPCSFDQGIITGLAKLLKHEKCVDLIVAHKKNGPCRGHGNSSCKYTVKWIESLNSYAQSNVSSSQRL
jgi:hypothetical protein